jgi:hypothetical protein
VAASGRVGEDALTERAVWQLVREYAAQVGIGELAPHEGRGVGTNSVSAGARVDLDDGTVLGV